MSAPDDPLRTVTFVVTLSAQQTAHADPQAQGKMGLSRAEERPQAPCANRLIGEVHSNARCAWGRRQQLTFNCNPPSIPASASQSPTWECREHQQHKHKTQRLAFESAAMHQRGICAKLPLYTKGADRATALPSCSGRVKVGVRVSGTRQKGMAWYFICSYRAVAHAADPHTERVHRE